MIHMRDYLNHDEYREHINDRRLRLDALLRDAGWLLLIAIFSTGVLWLLPRAIEAALVQ